MGNVASRDIYDKSGPKAGSGLETLAKNQGAMRECIGMLPPKDVTIKDGAITAFEEAALVVDTEGGAPADDLYVISDMISSTEKLHPGMLITIKAKDPARVVTVKNSVSPNGINTADGNDIVLSPDWDLTLQLVGGKWYEVRGRSSALAAAAQADATTALGRTSPATTTARGIGRVATAADALPGSTITNGPAFLDATTVKITPTPKANAVPQADSAGLLADGWLLRAAPTGFSGFYAGDTPPDGWFEENGAPVSRTTYARLFAVTGTRYGAGDGSTTFNLPDSRGLVKRVWDNGRGIDSGRVLGSTQDDQNKAHSHDIPADSTQGGTATVRHIPNGINNTIPVITSNSGGTEARMKNMSFMGIIKY